MPKMQKQQSEAADYLLSGHNLQKELENLVRFAQNWNTGMMARPGAPPLEYATVAVISRKRGSLRYRSICQIPYICFFGYIHFYRDRKSHFLIIILDCYIIISN